jgi:hypothetical protein
LPDEGDSDSLSVQLETVYLNGVSRHNLVENLVQLVFKIFEDMQQLHKNNEYLKHHLSKISDSAPVSLADGSK